MSVPVPRPVRHLAAWVTAWVAAAGVAVAGGLLAVSLLGTGGGTGFAAGSGATPVTLTSGTSPAPGAAAGPQRTAGGEVYATCAGPGAVPAVSGVPATGWEPGGTGATVQFERGDTEIRVAVTCDPAGVAVFTVTTDDRRGGGDDAPSPSPRSSASPPATDDHGGSGRSGSSGGSGGHGSDD